MKTMHSLRLSALAAAAALCISAAQMPPVSAESALKDSGISYTESVKTILNPGMGYTSTLWYRCAPGKTPVHNPTGSLVLMFVDIGAFSSGENGTKNDDGTITGGKDYPLDDAFFAGLRGTLENCRQNGCTVALRFRYDDDGTKNPEPETFDMLKKHIAQIDEDGFLRDYQDILMYVESGFVGCYGEQWGGKYCSLEQKAELLDLLLDVVPEPVPVTVRTPNIFAKWAGIEQKDLAEWQSEPGSRAARIGLYDDGYMGSDSDLGTYSDRAAETAWLGRQTETSYFGGEFSGNLEFAQKYDTYLPQNAIPEMYRTHLSYINSNIFALYQDYTFGADYDVPDVDNSAYYGQDVRQFIRDHLGYRFVFRDVKHTPEAEQGGTVQVRFSVENTGFAAPVRQQKAELLLEKDGNYLRTPLDLDSRSWKSCTVSAEDISVRIPGGLEPGEWNLYFKLSVGDNTISQTHMRSVQFANPDIWNAGLGANFLGTVKVKASDDPEAQCFTGFGTAAGTVYTVNGLQITDGAVSHSGELGEPCAESETGVLYIHNDTDAVYITAVYDAKADAEVHNIQFKNESNGESYWIYFASNGYVYFNHGDAAGCIRRAGSGIVEFRIPMGDVMGLAPGTEISGVRYFLQDSANEWALLSDVRLSGSFTLDGTFPVYSGMQTVTLREGASLPLRVADGAENAAYQWYHDGKAIKNASDAEYTVNAADSSASGIYSVTITADGTERSVEICEVRAVLPAAQDDDTAALLDYLLTRNHSLSAPERADSDGNGILTAADLTMLKRQ